MVRIRPPPPEKSPLFLWITDFFLLLFSLCSFSESSQIVSSSLTFTFSFIIDFFSNSTNRGRSQNPDSDLTQTGIRNEKHQLDRAAALSSFFLWPRMLHSLWQQISHSCRRLSLRAIGAMSVRCQCEASTTVPQHAGYRLYVNAILQSQGSETMPEAVEFQVLQTCILQNFLMQLHYRIRVVHSSGYRRWKQVWIAGVLSVL